MKRSGLENIPGVGPNIARHLHALGLQSVKDLQGQNPEDIYSRLTALRGCHIDRCVLYVLRCAVYYAGNGRNPDKLKWWNWKDDSKAEVRKNLGHRRLCRPKRPENARPKR